MQNMRIGLVLTTALAFVSASCTLDPAPPSEPMPTDGPNQVVLKVPGMT
jgi:hypothetical protein